MEELLHGCKAVAGTTAASFTWCSEDFLREQGVRPWSEMPLWIPTGEETPGRFTNERAVTHGLAFRPIADTIRDTLTWARARPAEHTWRAGLDPEKEARVLAAWHAR
jgi:2'-hydroxyisoflavone reductase